ncbi:MAG: nitroreductase family deazaflavin-dependent oxidoreductase [Halieaceae bacterium]|jgi:deazaflavin-dependent oxidoreductase (nitroreductase family)|nr:nitroreductase family deazaflavin-dependent oxidoreductase [Halieaceae bacterium]
MKKAMNSRREHAIYTPPTLFNKAITWMLRSPLHGLVSKDMMLITVSGRKTGKQYTIPVSYARDGDLVICSADRSRGWWKNVRSGETVTMQLRGKKVPGRATVIADDKEALIKGIETMLVQVPRDASHVDIRLDENNRPLAEDLVRATDFRIIIEIQELS